MQVWPTLSGSPKVHGPCSLPCSRYMHAAYYLHSCCMQTLLVHFTCVHHMYTRHVYPIRILWPAGFLQQLLKSCLVSGRLILAIPQNSTGSNWLTASTITSDIVTERLQHNSPEVINGNDSLHSSTIWLVCAVHGGLPMQCVPGQHDSLLCGWLNVVKPTGEAHCVSCNVGCEVFLQARRRHACSSYACCHVSRKDGTKELPYLFARPRASVHPTFLLELLQWSPKFSCMSTRSCHYHAMECATCQCKYLLIQASVCTYLFMPLFTS